jgi:hypothetical protein
MFCSNVIASAVPIVSASTCPLNNASDLAALINAKQNVQFAVPKQTCEDLDRSIIFSGEYSDSMDSEDLNQILAVHEKNNGNGDPTSTDENCQEFDVPNRTVLGCQDMDITRVFQFDGKSSQSYSAADKTMIFASGADDMDMTTVVSLDVIRTDSHGAFVNNDKNLANLNKTKIFPNGTDMEMTKIFELHCS